MDQRPIGFFDSGLGGISVLRDARRLMPGENYLYYGDSAHAPYGERTVPDILNLSRDVLAFLLQKGCKAVVIACNTATSAAADALRQEFSSVPIIGIEPAVKPAAERHPGGTVLVMATPRCLMEPKFLEQQSRFLPKADVVAVPCGGLMEFVERGELQGARLHGYLMEKLRPWAGGGADVAVLGCTHYPFLKREIAKVLGPDTEIIDGGDGTARQLRRRLQETDGLACRTEPGTVTFYNSLQSEDILCFSRTLLNLP